MNPLGNPHLTFQGHHHSLETRRLMSELARKNGTGKWKRRGGLPQGVKDKISATQRGKHYPRKSIAQLGNKKCLGKPKSLSARMASSEKQRGALNHNWKGGITPLQYQIRHGIEYKHWREQVFSRDDYRCFDCGAKSGETGSAVVLNADHVLPFALFPRLRFQLENGITLCIDCHRNTPTYGARTRNK